MSYRTSPWVHSFQRPGRLIAALLLPWIALASCSGEGAVTPPPTVVTVTVYNRLDLAISIAAGGTNYGTVAAGTSTVLTLPPGTQVLSWTSSKRRYSNGSPVPDDLSGATVSIAQNLSTIDVTNVVGGVPFFTPIVRSQVSDTASLQVVQPAASRCLGFQYGTSFLGFAWGYYRLDPGTTMRVYRGPTCTGAWRGWSFEILSRFEAATGRVSLTIDALP